MGEKHNLVLYIDRELVEKTRNPGVNLSKTFENHLKHFLNCFSSVNQVDNCESPCNKSSWWAGPDSLPNEFESKATHALLLEVLSENVIKAQSPHS